MASAALCLFVPAAPAQDNLGDVLGTTILNDVLTQIALPQVPVPDPEANGTQPTQQPTQTNTTTTPPAHAAGYYCKGESRRHVRGFESTPFRQCVAAMKQLRDSEGVSPREACASMTKRHFPGMKRTPYAVCVSGGRALVADRQ
jgi:hypothetical protein